MNPHLQQILHDITVRITKLEEAQQPQRIWVDLTDDEIRHIYICTTGWSVSDSDPMLVDFAKNIESKLRELNEAPKH